MGLKLKGQEVMKSSFWIGSLVGLLVASGAVAAPQVSFPLTYQSVAENGGTASVYVALWPLATNAVTVDFSTASIFPNGVPAIDGADYVGQAGTLTFQPGESYKFINITIIDNPEVNQPRGFQVYLSSPNGATLTASSYAYIVIQDNEVPNLVDAAFNP